MSDALPLPLHGGAPDAADISALAVLFNAGRYAEVASRARLLLERYADCGPLWNLLGAALQSQGKDSLPALQRAAMFSPDDAFAHSNLGSALFNAGRLDEAVACHQRALQISPDHVEAHYNLGNALHALGQSTEAIAAYRKALLLRPGFAIAHCNLGSALKGLGQFDLAKESFSRALEIFPGFAFAHNNLGTVLKDLGQHEAAYSSFCRALQIKPDYIEAHSNMLFACNFLAGPDRPAMLPEARRFGDRVARQARPYTAWGNAPVANRCLRVGLVSGDLRAHPVGYFLEGVLAALSERAADRLALFVYANQSAGDAVTARLRDCCRRWRPVLRVADEALAQQIRDDGIDVLVDLSGHTAQNRLPVFAWKAAPVQVSWLGYFATTGVAAIDYLIADPWTLPVSEEAQFSEKIWRLPETRLCFTPPDVAVTVGPLPALLGKGVTFGCFNSLAKMNEAVVALWSRILARVPGSRIFLKARQLDVASVREGVFDRFAAHGIGADRLILEGPDTRANYLTCYQRVDVVLDPFPYTGGATSAEALWMGVPVLTLAGTDFLSRQGVGLLMNAGLPDWVAADADDYVTRAVAYASDLPRLAALRSGLRQQVLASPVFDAARFAGHFETALRGMWQGWCERQETVAGG
jgi:predicted O-linked N-acetylglucosamine transferase (SPINDLY family)